MRDFHANVNGDEVKMATWFPHLGGLEPPDALARRAQKHVAEVLGQAATTFSKKVSPTHPPQPYDTAVVFGRSVDPL